MKQAMEETQRRRKAQELFNTAHNITPKGILKEIENPLEGIVDGPKQSRAPIEHKIKYLPKYEDTSRRTDRAIRYFPLEILKVYKNGEAKNAPSCKGFGV